MIIDTLANWEHYPLGTAWQRVFEFLQSLTSAAEEKRYAIQGDEIYAMISRYETRTPETAKLETHRKYVDIQVVLQGRERLEWFPRAGLTSETPYDPAKEAEFYRRAFPGPVQVDLSPGIFVMLYPQDAHMPGLTIGQKPERIKKVVVKVAVELLAAGE
jgi:YhcH/YjgK/YiaL family protein